MHCGPSAVPQTHPGAMGTQENEQLACLGIVTGNFPKEAGNTRKFDVSVVSDDYSFQYSCLILVMLNILCTKGGAINHLRQPSYFQENDIKTKTSVPSGLIHFTHAFSHWLTGKSVH